MLLLRFLLACALCSSLVLPIRADALDPDNPPREATAREKEVSEKASSEIAKSKQIPLLEAKTSPEAKALIERVNALARKIGDVSLRPGLAYEVSVVEKPDINAFTLPNGRIFLFRGLLDAVASEDELAAVMAHEIAHNTRLHALRGEQKAKKWNWASLAAVAAILAGGRDGANAAQFASYALTAVMNGYTLEFEKEADAEAVRLLVKAGYNPSAMVTFMERLQREQERRPEVRLGIFQTHPAPDERVQAALAELEKRGLAYKPREATDAGEIEVRAAPGGWQLRRRDVTLIEIASEDGNDLTSRQRADEIARRVSTSLLGGIKSHEMTVEKNQLLARGALVVAVSPADARRAGKSPEALARQWLANFDRLFWSEQLNGRF